MNKTILALVLIAIIFSGCLGVEETPTNRPDYSQPGTPAVIEEDNIMTEVVEAGDNIKVHYLGTFENGEVFDGSVDEQKNPVREPLAFKAGAGQMIQGFDAAVIGMALNEEKTVTLQPEEAYGTEGNHPMAGKVLVFWIKVVEIEK